MNQMDFFKSATFGILLLVATAVAREVPKVRARVGDVSSQHGLDNDNLPQNTAVYSGVTVTLTCWVSAQSASNPRVQWTEFAYSSNGQLISDGDYILPAHPQSARYSLVRNDPRQYDLVIANITLQDAGVYSCFDATAGSGETQRAAAELILIDGQQNCTSTIPVGGDVLEGVYYTDECTLDYRGNIIPHGQWEGPERFGQATSATSSRVWSGMSFYANRTMTGQYWRNTFNFTNDFLPVPGGSATNVPDFQQTADTERITVYWTPQAMYAEPEKGEYQVGEVIECFADAFPTASFVWHNLRTNERIDGSLLTIPASWEGFDQTLRCQAINFINGAEYSNDLYITGNVPGPTTTPTTTTPTTTTPPPAVANCFNLTGRWESVGPTPAYMCVEVIGENGNVHGVLRNDTDPYWVDLVGVTDLNHNFDHLSFTGIWPQNRAISTFIGECSRCHGEEHLLINAVSRVKGGPPCGVPGEINYSLQYDFKRNPSIACPPITMPPPVSDDE